MQSIELVDVVRCSHNHLPPCIHCLPPLELRLLVPCGAIVGPTSEAPVPWQESRSVFAPGGFDGSSEIDKRVAGWAAYGVHGSPIARALRARALAAPLAPAPPPRASCVDPPLLIPGGRSRHAFTESGVGLISMGAPDPAAPAPTARLARVPPRHRCTLIASSCAHAVADLVVGARCGRHCRAIRLLATLLIGVFLGVPGGGGRTPRGRVRGGALDSWLVRSGRGVPCRRPGTRTVVGCPCPQCILVHGVFLSVPGGNGRDASLTLSQLVHPLRGCVAAVLSEPDAAGDVGRVCTSPLQLAFFSVSQTLSAAERERVSSSGPGESTMARTLVVVPRPARTFPTATERQARDSI